MPALLDVAAVGREGGDGDYQFQQGEACFLRGVPGQFPSPW